MAGLVCLLNLQINYSGELINVNMGFVFFFFWIEAIPSKNGLPVSIIGII